MIHCYQARKINSNKKESKMTKQIGHLQELGKEAKSSYYGYQLAAHSGEIHDRMIRGDIATAKQHHRDLISAAEEGNHGRVEEARELRDHNLANLGKAVLNSAEDETAKDAALTSGQNHYEQNAEDFHTMALAEARLNDKEIHIDVEQPMQHAENVRVIHIP